MSILITNITVKLSPYISDPIAGPGQRPASAQPIPNSIDPVMSLVSMVAVFCQGKCHWWLRSGFDCFWSKKWPIREILSPPTITKRSVGSHAPKTSKNHWTRAGEIISDRASPKPKSEPAMSEMRGGRGEDFIFLKKLHDRNRDDSCDNK